MMYSYKMEMKPPGEYTKEELTEFKAPLLIIASKNDIFFPADIVFKKAKDIFSGPITTIEIDSKHLPTEEMMIDICDHAKEFLKRKVTFDLSQQAK